MIHYNDLIGKKVFRSFDSKTFVCCSLSINPIDHQISLVLVDFNHFTEDMLNPMELSDLGAFAQLILWDNFLDNYRFSQYRDFSSSESDINHNVLAINWQLIKNNFTQFLVPLLPEQYQKNTPKSHPWRLGVSCLYFFT